MGKYKAVGFDYGGVIGGGSKVGNDFNFEMCKTLGVTVEEYRDLYFSMNHLINTGRVETWEEFWPLFLEKLDKSEKLTEVLALKDKYAKLYIRMNGEVINLIDRLRKNSYKVGLLSNATLDNGIQMRERNLHKHFDAFHISAETGLQKPQPLAFELFANELGVKLPELIFVDDAEMSLSASKVCGFTPILFKNYDQLISDLEMLGVAIH